VHPGLGRQESCSSLVPYKWSQVAGSERPSQQYIAAVPSCDRQNCRHKDKNSDKKRKGTQRDELE